MRRQFMLSIVFVFASMFLLVGYAEAAKCSKPSKQKQGEKVKTKVQRVNKDFAKEVKLANTTVKAVLVILDHGQGVVLEGPDVAQFHNGNNIPVDEYPGAPETMGKSKIGVIVTESGSPDCFVWNGVKYCW